MHKNDINENKQSMHIPPALTIENPGCLSRAILVAKDPTVRYQGASGGVVSEIIRYFFLADKAQTAISFSFNSDDLFVPHVIYSYKDYKQVGSIYHDVNIANYLRLNMAAIKGAIVVVCLPCQVSAIRQLLGKNGIAHFIISLFCSGQQKKEATWRYLDDQGINRDDIVRFSYRGEGWPSGVRITTADGIQKFDPNVGGNWGRYRTPPFCLRRCMTCKDTFGVNADITAGDPWIKKYMDTENAGISMVGTLTLEGDSIIQTMIHNGLLTLIENVEEDVFVNSQRSAVIAKFVKRNTLFWHRLFYGLSDCQFYRRFILKKHLNWHNKFYKWFKRKTSLFLRVKLFFGAINK